MFLALKCTGSSENVSVFLPCIGYTDTQSTCYGAPCTHTHTHTYTHTHTHRSIIHTSFHNMTLKAITSTRVLQVWRNFHRKFYCLLHCTNTGLKQKPALMYGQMAHYYTNSFSVLTTCSTVHPSLMMRALPFPRSGGSEVTWHHMTSHDMGWSKRGVKLRDTPQKTSISWIQ